MIEIHLPDPCLIKVDYYKKDNYYIVNSKKGAGCSFYIEKDKLPYNSVLCFTNSDDSCSYITFYKEYLEVLHNELTTLQYTEEDIKEAFNILGIKVKKIT